MTKISLIETSVQPMINANRLNAVKIKLFNEKRKTKKEKNTQMNGLTMIVWLDATQMFMKCFEIKCYGQLDKTRNI